MRRLATIRKIDKITPIEGADKIELAHTGGWQAVVAKHQFIAGDLAVFFEIDSALPADDERYNFLHDRCLRKWLCGGREVLRVVRIKTMRLRGHISQGLFMPLEVFDEILAWEKKLTEDTGRRPTFEQYAALDVTEMLRVKHYDELAEQMGRITGKARVAGNAKGTFPTHLVPKTDEERLQNMTDFFDGRMAGVLFEATEKFDGSSATYIYAPEKRPADPFFVCSRNLELKEEDGNLYWDIAHKYNLFDVLKGYCDLQTLLQGKPIQIAIQGEIVGPGVNGNRDLYTEHHFRIFRIYDVSKGEWFPPMERRRFCHITQLPHVRVLRYEYPVFDELKSMEDFLEFVKGKTENGNEREGVVWKSVDGRTSFKVINNEYLLKSE